MNYGIKISISAIVTAICAWVMNYFFLPAMNPSSPGFWWYWIFVTGIFAVCAYVAGVEDDLLFPAIISGIIAVGMLIILIIGWIISWPMFTSNAYYTRLDVTDTTFAEEFEQVNWNTVPQIDKASSIVLGNRKMGTLTNEISQYNVDNVYTQTNINGKPVRVSPLGYSGFFKYQNNKHNGIPGYIVVDQVSKEATFERLENGMKYSPSAFFGKDLNRFLRKNFKTTLFGSFSFEIDDNGNPFWIVPTFRYTSGIGGAALPTGCILVNPVTGDLTQYDIDEIPEWIDHAIDANLAVSMIDSWGQYENGFLNTVFGQKDVKVSTEGYNYVTIGNDVYLYTGITSVVADESNIGFMLVNMRTSKAKYFEMPSAEEYSAMDSAKGQVQHLNYSSTFPILINVNGTPTYFLSLKDAAGLVKMYGFVSVENIQLLSVTESSLGVEAGMKEYIKILSNSTSLSTEKVVDTVTITAKEIYTAIIDGNTYYYIVDENALYVGSIYSGKTILPLLKPDDTITVSVYNAGNYFEILEVK